MECFVAVARELHFGRAAESIPMAQSALSKQIRLLEEEVGVELLQRTTRRVELTAAGEAFLGHVEALLAAYREAKQAAVRADAGEIGHLRVGFGGSATYELMPRLARTFRAAVPDVRLDLRSEMVTRAQIEALHREELDIGFLRPPIAEPELNVETLRREKLLIALPERHPQAGNDVVDLATMMDSDFVTYPSTAGASIYSVIVSACNEAGFSPRVAQEASETHMVISLVAAGMGVALVPEAIRFLRMPGVVYRDLVGVSPEIDLAVAWRRSDNRPVVKRMIDLAKELTADFHGPPH